MSPEQIEEMYKDKELFIEKLSVALAGEGGCKSLKYVRDYLWNDGLRERLYEEGIIVTYDNDYQRIIYCVANSNLANAEAVIKLLLR